MVKIFLQKRIILENMLLRFESNYKLKHLNLLFRNL